MNGSVTASSVRDDPVQTAWKANLQVNQALLEHLTPAMLGARTPGGGYTVAQHLAHLVESTKYWGSKLERERFSSLPDLFTFGAEVAEDDQDMGNPDAFSAEADPARILEVLTQTAAAARDAVANAPAGFSGDLPHASAEAFPIHALVHDAHHRGQLLLALKTSGFALPDEDALWTPWKTRAAL